MNEASLLITYGGGEAIYYIFNAIAALFKSEIFKNIIYIASILIGFWNIIISISKQSSLFLFKWFLWFIFILQLLLLPTLTIVIEDPLAHYKRTVDNVPYILGVFASITSQIGDVLTKEIESLFTLPDYLPYHNTGHVFASKLFKQMHQFKVRDANLKNNLSKFIQNCVVYDAMVGFKYSIGDLQNSDNILDLISNTSHIIGFSYQTDTKDKGSSHRDGKNNSKVKTEIVSCVTGIDKIKASLAQDVNSVAAVIGKKIGLLSESNNKVNQAISSELLSKIASSYRLMTGISKSGEEILKQEMLINAIGDATKHRVEELGHSQNYAAAKMLLQQRSSYNVVASVASQTLSSMKVVFEVICYSSFIFIPIVTLLPNGIRIISNYFCMLVWIQLWAPLYAVLNLLISISAKAKSIGIIGDSGLTMLTSVGYSNLHADIESMAGYLSMSIPFISYSIVKGGGGSIMNLANSLGSNYQSASGNVAQEIVSGNLSMGNIAYATSSHNNKSGFKHDTNFSHHAGRMEMGSDDGSVVFRTESGTIGFKSGVGMTTSSWDHQLNLQSNLTSSLSKSLQKEESHMIGLNKEYSHAESKAFRSASNLMQRLVDSSSYNQNWSTGKSVEESDNITKSRSFMKELQNRLGYNSAQAADVAASLGIGGGIMKMSANVSSNFRNSRDWYDAISKGSQIADSNGYSNSLNQTIRNSDQINFSDNEQNERALAKDLAKSFEKMQSIRHSENISKQNVERLSDAQNYMKSYGGNLNQDLSQKFLEYIATQKVNTSSNLNHAPSEIGHSTARKIIMTKGEDYYAYLQGFMGQELGNMTGNSHISGKFRFDNIDQSNIEPIQDRNLTSENLTLALPNINYKDKERNLLYDNDMNLKRQKVKDSVSSEYERFEKRKAQQFAEIDTEHTRLENNYVDQSIKIKLSKAISNIPKALISQKDIKDNNQTKNHKENNVNSDFKDITKLFEKKSDD